jgi:hypothetical protein
MNKIDLSNSLLLLAITKNGLCYARLIDHTFFLLHWCFYLMSCLS